MTDQRPSTQLARSVDEQIRLYGEAEVRAWLAVRAPESWGEFLTQLYSNIDSVLRDMARHANHYQADSEETLTHHVCSALKRCGYRATTEADSRGHVDLAITPANGDRFLWLGEAKIHLNHGYGYLDNGISQLLTRYSSGLEPEGGLVIYVLVKEAKTVYERWRKYLVNKGDASVLDEDPDPRSFTFVTAHPHAGSGLDYRIRHMMAPLYYSPDDTAEAMRRRKPTLKGEEE